MSSLLAEDNTELSALLLLFELYRNPIKIHALNSVSIELTELLGMNMTLSQSGFEPSASGKVIFTACLWYGVMNGS